MVENYVYAIAENKIVKVTEEYAKREGLPIIRKQPERKYNQPSYKGRINYKKKEDESKLLFDDFRKPLNWNRQQIITELVEHFPWIITKRRKDLNLSRKQLAQEIGEQEDSVKMIENGILPSNNFILINKLENYLKISIRKNPINTNQSMRALLDKKEPEKKKEEVEEEIEVIEEIN